MSLQLIFSLAIFNIYPKTIIVSKIQSYLAIHPFGNYVLSINGSIFYGVVLLIGILLLYKKDNETVIALLSAVPLPSATTALISSVFAAACKTTSAPIDKPSAPIRFGSTSVRF